MAIGNDIRKKGPQPNQARPTGNFGVRKNPIFNSRRPQVPKAVPYGQDVSGDERAVEPVYDDISPDLASMSSPTSPSQPQNEEGFGFDLNTLPPMEEDEEEDEGVDSGEQAERPKDNSESRKLQEETLRKSREEEAKRLATQQKRSDIKQPDQDQTSQQGHQNQDDTKSGQQRNPYDEPEVYPDTNEDDDSGEVDEGDRELAEQGREESQAGNSKSAVKDQATDKAKDAVKKEAGAAVKSGAKAAGKAVSAAGKAAGKAILQLYTNPGTAPWAWGITAAIIAIILIVILIASYLSGGKKQSALKGTGGPVIETRPISDDDALTKLLMLTGDATVQTEVSKEKTTQIIAALDVAINDPNIAGFTVPDPIPAKGWFPGDQYHTIPLRDALEAVKAKFVAAEKISDVNQRKTDLLAAVKALQAISTKLNPWCSQVRSSSFFNVAQNNDKAGLLTGWFVRKDGAKVPIDNTMCQFLLFVEQSKEDSLLKDNGVNILQLSSIVGNHTIYVSDDMNSKNRAINAQYSNICARCEKSHTAECDQKYKIAAGEFTCQMSQHPVGRGLDIGNLDVDTAAARQRTEAFGHWVIKKLPELTAKKILIHQLVLDDEEWVRDNVDKTGGKMLNVPGHKDHTHIGFGDIK